MSQRSLMRALQAIADYQGSRVRHWGLPARETIRKLVGNGRMDKIGRELRSLFHCRFQGRKKRLYERDAKRVPESELRKSNLPPC